MKTIAVSLVMAFVILLGVRPASALESYQGAAEKCDAEVLKTKAQLLQDYGAALDKLADEFRLQGDLDKTLAVKKEIERFASEKSLDLKHVVDIPVKLRDLQNKFLAAPKKSAEEIARSYLTQLEDMKRKLTIDNKLDDAVNAQKEIQKIQKKYEVVNPARGMELSAEQMPKFVTMTQSVSFPIIVEGQRVGVQGLSRGETYRLMKVDGTQLTIKVGTSPLVVPVEVTDLVGRIERLQKGLSESETADDVTETKTPRPEQSGRSGSSTGPRLATILRNSTWTWTGGSPGDTVETITIDDTLRVQCPRHGWEAFVESVGEREAIIRMGSLGRAQLENPTRAHLRFNENLTEYKGINFGGDPITGKLVRRSSR